MHSTAKVGNIFSRRATVIDVFYEGHALHLDNSFPHSSLCILDYFSRPHLGSVVFQLASLLYRVLGPFSRVFTTASIRMTFWC